MKSNQLPNAIIACVVFGVTGTTAFAADKWTAEGDNFRGQTIVSSQTRTQVVSELAASRTQGQLVQDGAFEYVYPQVAATKDGGHEAIGTGASVASATARDRFADLYFGG